MLKHHWKRAAWMTGLVLLALSSVVARASAAGPSGEVRDKFRSGNTVVIGANETIPHDLYVTGSTAQINGRIDGDLFVAAGTVNVTGPVSGSLYIGGGTVTVSGPVSGDVFVGGGNVTVSGTVGRQLRVAGGSLSIASTVQLDLLAAAGTLALQRDSRVAGDLMFSAGQTTLDGNVTGSVLGSTSAYSKTGTISGAEDVRITASQAAPKEQPARSAGRWALDQVQRYLGIFLVGALLIAFAAPLVRRAATRLRERPLASLGFGALGIVVFVPALIAVFIAIVLVAIPLGMLGLGRMVVAVVLGGVVSSAALSFALMLVLLFVAAVLVGLVLGQLALERLGAHPTAEVYVALAVGLLAVVLITALPVVGWLVQLVVASFGLGALLLGFRRGAPATVAPIVPTPPDVIAP